MRDLPLFWKLLLPFLALMVIFGTIGAFLIVRDVSSRAQDAIDTDLSRRSFDARGAARDRELYLVESVNFATSLQGISSAIAAGDRAAVQHLLGSVLLLKTDVTLLVATDPSGRGVAALRRPASGGKVSTGTGGIWSHVSFAADVLRDPKGGKRTGFLSDGSRRLFAVAAPVCVGQSGCAAHGIAIVGIDIGSVVAEAAGKTGQGGGIAIYDEDGTLMAQNGLAAAGSPPLGLAAGRLQRRSARAAGVSVATLYAPFDVQGRAIGALAVTVPVGSSFSAVRGTAVRLGVIALLVMAGVVAIGAALSRSILAQLRPLVATNRALGKGELSARAPVVSGDELGELAQGVNLMAEQLQASYEMLEMRVAERTEEVRRLLEERTDFFASVSHDLRTPLAIIRSQALMVLDPAFATVSPHQTMRLIVDSSDQLLALITELLDMARAEAGRIDVDVEPVQLRDIVKDLRPTMQGLTRAADLRLNIGVPKDLPKVHVDPRRIKEVLVNLVDNAVKYTPPGGSVGISAHAKNGHVEVVVRDTGIGIPEEDRDKIFQPFYRVKANTPQRGQASSGLGLALSKRLVEAQGGTISFTSELGAGSTFTVALPVS